MACKMLTRSATIQVLLLLIHFISAQQYKIPNVKIQAFKPKGFRASIEDAPNLALFTFQGNVNKQIGSNEMGAISGEVTSATSGRWVVNDPDLALKVGDVINYHVFVAVNSKGYVADNLTFVVQELEDISRPSGGTQTGGTKPANCKPTVTKVRGGSACSGQTIFEDHFNELQENVWQVEQYFPIYHPEYPFVSYQRTSDNPTVLTSDGYLHIKPKLEQNPASHQNSGTLNLFSGCTAPAEACVMQASGADILPPVVSGRITSKSFAFTYGNVHVRAKLPKGDWLYPEILLEPFLKKYGSHQYASGVIKIATARGNAELNSGSMDYSNRVLYGGPIMDFQCRNNLLSSKASSGGQKWGDDYHIYSVRWAPDRITLSVDGQEWARVEPAASGLAGRFPSDCNHLPRSLLGLGSKMAPFDDYFYITLGVAAGGVTEFPDGLTTGESRPKPWSNHGRKATLYFWQDLDAWYNTWTNPEMIVDYVKVVAL